MDLGRRPARARAASVSTSYELGTERERPRADLVLLRCSWFHHQPHDARQDRNGRQHIENDLRDEEVRASASGDPIAASGN
jgi:hypothetical protein